MEIDLNEDNYDYQGLIGLFSLDPTFNKEDLKQAKLKVLKLHPDKSGLHASIYIFMSKMYYKLEEVYSFTHHETDKNKLSVDYGVQEHFKNYLQNNKIDPVNNYETFSKEFNKMFESVYISENNDGYGDWLKSDDDLYDKDNLEESRKSALSKKGDIVETLEIQEYDFKQPAMHADVKESYVNPFVTMDLNKVYKEKPKFKTVQEYETFIKKDEISNTPLSNEAGIKYIKNKEDLLNNKSKMFAFERVKHQEKMEKKYNKYISSHLRLEH